MTSTTRAIAHVNQRVAPGASTQWVPPAPQMPVVELSASAVAFPASAVPQPTAAEVATTAVQAASAAQAADAAPVSPNPLQIAAASDLPVRAAAALTGSAADSSSFEAKSSPTSFVRERWFQQLREGIEVLDTFFKDKKNGQFPVEVDGILAFASILSKHDISIQLSHEMKAILSNPTYVGLMRNGLITKPQHDSRRDIQVDPQPGDFFTSRQTRSVGFTITHDGGEYSFIFFKVLATITSYGKRVDNADKAGDVNFYLLSMLSRSFCSYIEKYGGFMARPDRSMIIGMTIMEPVKLTYGNNDKISAMKGLLTSAIKDETIGGLITTNFGSTATMVAKNAIDSFDPNKIGEAQGCLMEALATRDIAPIKRGVQDFLSSVAGNAHANDKVKVYRQKI